MLTLEGTAGNAARSGPWTRWAWSVGVAGTGRRSGGPGRERHGSGLSRRQYAQPNAMDPVAFTASVRTAGRFWDAVNPGFHGVRTRWIRGFMTFQWAGRTRNMRLTVPVRPEPSFGNEPPGCGH